jgi:ribulose-phosphate 3-epimerase
MCADVDNLLNTVNLLEHNSVEFLHVDIMDGIFVPNFALGTDHVNKIRELSQMPMDLHMLVVEPLGKYHWFSPRAGDIVTIHYESTRNIGFALNDIRSIPGVYCGLAINHQTPIEAVDEFLDILDVITLMAVKPGFAGQRMLDGAIGKVRAMKKHLADKGYPDIRIEVDGNVSFEHAHEMRAQGADIFVAGSSSVFCDDMDRNESIRLLRESIA